MMNISHIYDCYGCGVCALVCTKQIISIKLNENGFYEPFIMDNSKCTDCGLCIDVCAYSHEKLSLSQIDVSSYAAWSLNDQVRHKSSSGGIGFEVGRMLLEEGYKVCGVRYNIEENRAEHYIATTLDEFIPTIGSKYIQSFTLDGFKAINRKEKNLVIGTPCQIDSFRRYVKKLKVEDHFVLMDFFCHGVPSKLMWNKYIVAVEKNIGKITNVSWRNKISGWHDSYNMLIEGETVVNSRLSQGDMFYRLFLSDACLGKACYDYCKYKYDQSSADIRIGDFWGETYRSNEEGVSAVVTFTEKGKDIINNCNCALIPYSFSIVAEGQMRTVAKRPFYSQKLNEVLKRDCDTTILDVYRLFCYYYTLDRYWQILRHPLIAFFRIVKKAIPTTR